MVVKVTISHNNVLLVESSPTTLDKIDKHFTYSDTSECFNGFTFDKNKIIMRHMLIRHDKHPHQSLLPIGLLDDLTQYLDKQGAKYVVKDERKVKNLYELANKPKDKDIENSLGYITLYDYQVEAVKGCLEAGRGIVKSPTASGKTEIFTSLCKLTNIPTLILFARIDLARQTRNRMDQAGLDAGIVQGGNIDENHQIVMATVQSSHKLKRTDYEMVIVDECHRASSEQYQDVLASNSFKYRFGFSATPFVKDKYKVARTKAFLGDLILEVDPKKLVKHKRIAMPTIHMIPIDQPLWLDGKMWRSAEKWGIVENQYRNRVIANLCKGLKGQILILVKMVDHGKMLEEQIDNSIFLYGETKVKDREEIVQRFRDGEEIVLIASTIFDEGVDIKNVNHVIIAGGGASYVKTLQRLGRGLRITETKKSVDIFDFYDTTNEILLRHAKKRIKTYEDEGFDQIKMRTKQFTDQLSKHKK